MRTLEQGGTTAPITDAQKLRGLLDSGKLTYDRLTDKGRALLLDDDVKSGKRTYEDLTKKGLKLLNDNGFPTPTANKPLSGWLRQVGTSLKGGAGETVANLGATMQYGSAKMQASAANLTDEQKRVMQGLTYNTATDAEVAASAAKLGATGEKLEAYGAKVAEKYPAEPVEYKGWKSWLDPEWLTKNALRSLPSSASLMLPSVVAGVASGGLGVLGSIGTGTLNRAMESAMEAGGTYRDALDSGMSEADALAAADEVFARNMKLVGLDVAQMAIAFGGKIPGVSALKGALGKSVAGKVATTIAGLGAEAASERYEEMKQHQIQTEAMGGTYDPNSPEAREAGAIGALMGIGLGGAGAVSRMATEVHKAAAAKLPDAQRLALNTEIASRMSQGKTWAQAAAEAMDELGKQNPMIGAAVREATEEVQARYPQAQQPATYQEQAGTTIENVPTMREVTSEAADYRDALVELRVGDKVSLEGDATQYTVVDTPKAWQVTVRDPQGVRRTVSKDAVIGDWATLRDRLSKRRAGEVAATQPVPKRTTKRAGRVAPPVGAQVTPQAAPENRAETSQTPLVVKAAVPSPQVAPTGLPQTQAPPQIVAPVTSQRTTATTQGKFPGAGRVALGESTVEAMAQVSAPQTAQQTPATIQEITTELRAKKEAQESFPETEWTGRTPDILKQTVQRIESEQGTLPKAVKEKYGEAGFAERQVTGVANLFAEMRAKDDVRVSDAEVEKVLSATKSAQTVKAQVVNWFRNAGAAFKDVFSYEWRLADYPRFQDQIRRFQGAQRDAQVSALETYLAIVSPMDDATLGPKRMKLFSRLIDLRDMLEDIRAGKKIAGALTEQQLVDAEAELMAKADDTVKQSLANHDAIMKAAWKELQRRNKVDPDAPGREHYYPHKILDYVREIDAKYPGLGAKLKAPYRYYLQKRGGTTRLFDTDYLTVTMNHLTKLYLDNATDDFALEVARDYDMWPKFSEAERQRYGSPEAGRLYEIGDERYFGWSYDAFHRTKNPILTEITDPMLVQEDLKARKEMQRFLTQAHIIPEEIANRLAQLKAPGVKAHTLNAIRAMQWFWKNIVLGPFGAGLPFQVSNFIGDTINLFREDPRAVLFIPQGWRAAKEWQKGQVSEKFLRLMDVAEQTRVVEAGMMRAGGMPYDPALRRLEPIRYALKSLNPFEGYRKLSERRELSGRLAKLMTDLERIGKGEMVVAKIFDVKKLEAAGMTPVEVAGKIAREYTVDYGKLTPEGRMVVRDLAFPFSTFYYGNLPNWITYVQRNPGEATLKFLLPLAAMAAFNAFRFPDEEENLPPYYRVMPHLITGYKTADGKPIIVSFQTPIDQAAKMLGLEVVGDLARQVLSGKKSLEDAAKELAGNMALTMPRQMWNLANVFFKAPIEAAMNKNTFTGAPIVSEDVKDTPEGTRQRLNYVLQQWLSPYGQYMRAARDIEPDKAIKEWLLEGPADIKRALGIREVDLEREQINRFYDALDRLEGAYAVWKDKRERGEDAGPFADMAKLKRLQAVARDFTDQWKVVSRIKADKTRTQEQKDKEVRERYKSMARRTQTVLNPGK